MRRKKRYWLILFTIAVLFFVGFVYNVSSSLKISYVVQFARVYDSQPFESHQPNSGHNCINENSIKQPSTPSCEHIHVAIVCAGYSASRQLVPLLKSLLFYRKTPVHFHLIVDGPITRHILSTLFRTWNIPSVEQSFYDVSSVVDDVSWIPNKHYSGIYGLLKLTLPKILPKDLDKVLVLDNDVIFTSDVVELWKFWSHFNASQILGVVENQSQWYLGTLWRNYKPWPAIGRGFNTGVILMDLQRMRNMNWMDLWTKLTKQTLTTHGTVGLADQDIFNVVLKHDPAFLLQLPCEWNLQLGENSLATLCSSSLADLKIIHWNSPRKLNTKSRHAEFFRKQYQAFLEIDGNLFRRELFHCQNATSLYDVAEEEISEDDVCYEFRRAQRIVHRTHLFYTDFDYRPKTVDVTLVSQLSFDRLQMLEQLLYNWDGPASICLYLSDAEAQQFLTFVLESPTLSVRKNVGFHVVYKEGDFYPINKLRNVALTNAVTPFVFLADVDFLPMFGLYEILCQTLASQDNLDFKAFVVPAFETQRYKSTFPKSKTDLLNMLDTGQLFIFRQEVWAKGHLATNYERWRTASAPYAISWSPDFEPYIVVNRTVPLYDVRFAGFGWNKVSHIMELDYAGYDFLVLPNAFAIHLPHAPSFEIVKYRSSSSYRRCLKLLKGEFIKDLAKRYSSDRVKNVVVADSNNDDNNDNNNNNNQR